MTVSKQRAAQSIEGSAVIDAIIKGEGRAIVGDGTLDIDRLAVAGRTQTAWYVTGPAPVTWEKIRELNASGFSVVSPPRTRQPARCLGASFTDRPVRGP